MTCWGLVCCSGSAPLRAQSSGWLGSGDAVPECCWWCQSARALVRPIRSASTRRAAFVLVCNVGGKLACAFQRTSRPAHAQPPRLPHSQVAPLHSGHAITHQESHASIHTLHDVILSAGYGLFLPAVATHRHKHQQQPGEAMVRRLCVLSSLAKRSVQVVNSTVNVACTAGLRCLVHGCSSSICACRQ